MEQETNKYKEALRKAARKIEELSKKNQDDDIAIVGHGCRFPGGANNPEQFWHILSNGIDTVTKIKKDRFDYKEYYSDNVDEIGKMYTKYGAFLNVPVDEFDNRHFEISPVEASSIDPQQRLLLEVSWEALEDSGVNIKKLRGSNTGVFVGISSSDYFRAHMFSGDEKKITPYSVGGITYGAASGRLSYFYDFKGPAVTFDTACSSSLVALNAAVESLKKGECSLAIVGGANMLLTPESFIGLSKQHGLAADGRCKTFTENADGFGRGEGCGVIVLKKLSEAKADNDTIYAIVKGVSVGQDGRTNGMTAPNGSAQKRVIKQALTQAKMTINDIDYIETHGTGTPLGDTIEVQALNEIFKDKKNDLLIGAVKTNIAHLEAASGMAGLIKIIQSFKHNQLPPNIHFNKKSSKIDWGNLQVVNKLVEWKPGEKIRRAGISAFGFTGTLAHAIIEEPPLVKVNIEEKELPYHLLTLSAKNEEALKYSIINMKEYLSKSNESIGDICYSSNICKSHMDYRFAANGSSKADILNMFDKFDHFKNDSSKFKMNNITFLFTGQGSIYKNIGKTLYEKSSGFKKTLDLCNEKFYKILNFNILDIIYGENDNDLLNKAIYSQPIIFSIEYALTKIWESLGIKANSVIGHSIGEFTAACYAGILSLDDAIKMIAHRGMLMDTLDIDGKMVGVLTSVEVASESIKESGCKNVSIAAINASENVTISGLSEEVDKVIEIIQKKQRVFIEELNITHPFHSVLMKEFIDSYKEKISDVKYSENNVTFISSITGKQENKDTFGNAIYWSNHLSNTVNFYKAMETAKELESDIFIEIGGDATLCGLANQCINGEALFLPSLRKGLNEYKQLFDSISLLYLNGVQVDWKSFYKEYKKEKVILPNYSFQRKKYWIDLNKNKKNYKEFVLNKNSEKLGESNSSIGNNTLIIENSSLSLYDIELEIKNIINIIAGLNIEEINREDNLFSLGFDSLLLLNFKKHIDNKYKLNISINEFLLNLNTVGLIAEYIEKHLPKSEMFKQSTVKQQSNISCENTDYENAENVNYLNNMENRIKDIHAQLENLMDISRKGFSAKPASNSRSVFPKINNNSMIFEEDSLNNMQKKFVDDFILKYNTKTKSSKNHAEKYNTVFSDWINSLNFRMTLKKLLYPIISKRSQGTRFWDIDGNEYIDLAIGYGVHYFGHNPPFITDAIKAQLEKGFELGPQSDLAGKVAKLIKDLTGVERVAFCNTGSEAVMVALRIARACKRKEKIVKFSGSYHGTFDGILTDTDEEGPYPTSLGSTYGNIKDTVSLLYGSKESLEYIKENKNDIAAVLVEPVQSRRPGFQPKEFLKELRVLTEELGIILIFDEMLNGFRIQTGGAQAYFGIEADIVTYGKIVGGGLPIGVVAGKQVYLDSIDGGSWSFGDNSIPDKETVTFAGTFCKNPLSMAAAYAVLSLLKEKGNDLQMEVNEKTRVFVEEVNEFFGRERVPMRISYFGSQFKFESYGKYDSSLFPIEMDLFFYLLNYKGIYTWERRTCCFNTEISYKDIEIIISKIKESIYELRESGFEFSEETKLKKVKNIFPNHKVIPMTLNQKRLFSTILINENDPYNIIGTLEIKGRINIKKLETVFQMIIARHESLRTKLYIEEDLFVQEVIEEIDFKINEVEKQESQSLDDLIKENISKFDLSKGPLFKVTLIKASQEKEILLIDLHHTIADGRSLDILGQELIKLYSGENLEPIYNQYSDYVLWEEEFLNSEEIKENETYWLKKLSGEREKLNLPFDHNHYSINQFAGNTVKMPIESDLVFDLKQFAKKTESSLFMVLAAAFKVLLYKLSKTKDIIIGTPVTNRGNSKFDNNIGMFTNTIILRNQISNEMKFTEFLSRLKQSSLEAYAHMNYPFNFLVNKLNTENNGERDPLINVMFIYENIDERMFSIDNVEIKTYDYKSKIAEFDFTLEILEDNGAFNVNLNYKTSLLKEDSVTLWGKYFITILKNIIKDSALSISDIQLLTDNEKEKIIKDFNNTEVIYPKNKTIQQLFEEQVRKVPNEVAVVCKDDKLTYDELNRKSNQVARILREKGVKADSIVGIFVERSIHMIIGIMGVLKSGGAYLPIDINLPRSRIEYMLEDSGVEILITAKELEDDLQFTGSIINISKDCYSLDDNNLSIVNNSHDLANVIYTSGSTGNPKGVMVEHKQVNNFIHGIVAATGLNEYKNILCITTISFDIFGLETLVPLAQGMKIVIVNEEEVIDGDKLSKVIVANKVEVMQCTPSRLKFLLESNKFKKSIKELKTVLIGGEEVPKNLVEELDRNDNLKVFNVYGPTETTIWSTSKLYVNEDNNLTIGKPINNTQVYILDENMQIVPIGVPGELCIGGDGVARGYLNKENLTAEKFVESPFEKGLKIYKTGDLTRWLSNGEIEFLGRIDNQVKVRGYRIELEEIENRLLSLENIKQAVVVGKIDQNTQKYLCAYVTCYRKLNTSEIKDYLSATLPDYMIPSFIIEVAEMPLNSNGKINRKALPDPNKEDQISNNYVAPRNKMEENLVEIWSEILGVKRIGINDNFFDLGGHSLNATILVGRIHKLLDVKIPIKELFKAKNIKELTKYISKVEKNKYEEIEKLTVKQQYYRTSSAQKRMYLLQERNNGTVYNMPKVIEVIGKLDLNIINRVIRQLIERHESLRTSFEIVDEDIVQKIQPIDDLVFKIEMLTVKNEDEISEKVANFIRPFNLKIPPLIRVGVINVEEERNIIIFDIHHIVSDGISVAILTKEFSDLYSDKKLKSLKIQYKEFSAWQLKILKSEELKKQEKYWLGEYQGRLPETKFPTDYPVPSKRDFKGNNIEFKIDKTITDNLKGIGRKTSSTLYMVILANLNILLSKYCQQEDIVVGTPVSGRTSEDLENVIGLFVNTLAIRTKVDNELNFIDYLNIVKEKTLMAFDNQEYQFDVLVQKVGVVGDLNRNPLFDVMFVLQNMQEDRIELDNLRVTSYPFKENTEKFNITIACQEKEGELLFNLSYATSLFKESTIEKIIEYFKSIIHLTSKNLDIKIETIDLITEGELSNIYNGVISNDLNEEDLEFTF
ncbi:amino acid adenylation domain-containing protein [Lysinibacillus sp. NPDC056185]|uniref:amino acid adenylation domain-containing protein n=1 Tax=Lysinibacillus sp. NPDC056185 TaxID=3345739 RepID=UPI0039F0A2C3